MWLKAMATPKRVLPSVLYGQSKVTFEELHYLLLNMKKKAYAPLLEIGKLDAVKQTIKGTSKDEVFYAGKGDIVKAGGGYDALVSAASVTALASGLEALQLVGKAKVGKGNGAHNNIIGTKGANLLDGK